MSWLEFDSEAERPEFGDVESAWNRASFAFAPLEDVRIAATLRALRKTYVNGGALFGSFVLPGDPVLDWFAARNRFEECQFIQRLVMSPAFRAALPRLAADAPPQADVFARNAENAFSLDGQIASSLWEGGAYFSELYAAADAKKLGQGFSESLIGSRYSEAVVFTSSQPWASWFSDIMWDYTWIVIDKRHRRSSILAVTDTD